MAEFDWLRTSTSLDWQHRSPGVATLRISRESLAQHSLLPNDRHLISKFLAWAGVVQSGQRFCLAWYQDNKSDDSLVIARYTS